jgi:hypothetical protein
MNSKIKFSVLTLLVMLLGFTSCKKELSPVSPEDITIQDLQISADFDWKTTRDIQLTLTGDTDGLVEVTNLEGVPYQKVFLTANETCIMKLTVPSYETSVKLKYLDQDIKLELTGNSISHQF